MGNGARGGFRGAAAAAITVGIVSFTLTGIGGRDAAAKLPEPEYAGSAGCRECHQRFYELWEPSRHGTAMQPYTAAFARRELAPQASPIRKGAAAFEAHIGAGAGWVTETVGGRTRRYPIVHVLGGKNVYYFLTPLERGRLQVLPVAYDAGRKAWFETTESMVRHFPDPDRADAAIEWRDPLLTFNTACFNCHVSQLAKNYDPATDSYRTTWGEPGINCETCHGPAGEHVRACRAAAGGPPPKDLAIISVRTMSPARRDDVCAPCHAKMRPITAAFTPGDRYFDHFDLTTLEHPDFYPDGRDLGENYTYTAWLMSPCVIAGRIECAHCHTPSGRYRFDGEKANDACRPCHQAVVTNAAAHSRHPADSPARTCVSCHMPTTTFARMRRTDHSMRPPAPAATLAFKSPNACNLCHEDKDAAWADRVVREWRPRDYQSPILRVGRLVDAARRRDWSRLDEIVAYIGDRRRDAVFAASLVRLLEWCPDQRKWTALQNAVRDPSPLVRAAAARGLEGDRSPQTRRILIDATADDTRLVRIAAAAALAADPDVRPAEGKRARVAKATEEYVASLVDTRPDDWASHYNLGNYSLARGDLASALLSFEGATRLRPDAVPPLVNAAIVHARMGRTGESIRVLQQALRADPANAAAHFNLGLGMAEAGDLAAAERHLRRALDSDPAMHEAAFNLCVLLAQQGRSEGVDWCRKAHASQAGNPKYGYTLAFYLRQDGRADDAAAILERVVRETPAYADAYLLLIDIYGRRGDRKALATLYERIAGTEALPAQLRRRASEKLRRLE